MKFTNLVLSIFIATIIFSTPILANEQDDDFLLLNLPGILAASQQESFPPEWGAFNLNVCCPTSTAIFSVTLDGVTRTSSFPACSSPGAGTFTGFSVTTPGPKNFVARLNAATCPALVLSRNITFEDDLRYLIQLEFQNNIPVVEVFAQEITVPSQKSKVSPPIPNFTERMTESRGVLIEGEIKGTDIEQYKKAN